MTKLIIISLRVFFFIGLFFLSFSCAAEALKEIDSIKKVTLKLENGIEKVDNFNEISNKYFEYNVIESQKYADSAYLLSKKINYSNGKAYALLNYSQVNRIKRYFSKSVQYSYDALNIFKNEKNNIGISCAYFELGTVYKNIPNYQKAEDAVLKALEFCKKNNINKLTNREKNKLILLEIGSETQIAHIYTEQLDRSKDSKFFIKAEYHYKKAVEICSKSNIDFLSTAYLNLSNIYLIICKIQFTKNEIEKAINYAKMGVSVAEKQNSKIHLALNNINLGEAFLILKNNKEALHYFEIANKLLVEVGNKVYLLVCKKEIIKIYVKSNQSKKVKSLLDEFYNISVEMKDKLSISYYYDQLSSYYFSINEVKKGIDARKKHEVYKDSINFEEKANALLDIEMKYIVNQKDNEIRLLNKERKLIQTKISQEKTIKNFLILIVLLTGLMFILFYNRYKLKLKSNKIIEAKSKELEKLSIVAREARNGILITDELGNIEFYNEEFSKIHNLNKSLKLEIKKTAFDISKNESIHTIIEDCVKHGKPKEYELLLSVKGEDIWIKTNVMPVLNENNKVTKLVFIETDISELIKARETAENALLIQEQFLANTSHEIRTPMNGIIGMTNQIMSTSINEEQAEYLNAIQESSNNLMNIINGILDVSKIKAGKFEIEKIPFKLRDVLNSLKVSFKIKAQEKNIKLIFTIDNDIPQVLIGDSLRLTQIINNLLNNAIKFTEFGSVNLIVSVLEKKQNKIKIAFNFKDTGIGIAPDKLEHIFEVFSQAELEISRKFGGTGLGLNISKSLIELQGGEINVESKLNEGSTFTFYIEYEIGNENDYVDSLKVETNLPENIDLNYLQILLVEDNIINQKVAIFELNKWKINTDVADNPIKAFELLEKKHYDLILMDLSMPIMSGFEATIKIRKNQNQLISKIPIIALTASAQNSEKIKCLEAGMDDYISKPFNADILYQKIIFWTKKT
jgi:signal transduction histidine kinase/CheY-like chemotaxis protein